MTTFALALAVAVAAVAAAKEAGARAKDEAAARAEAAAKAEAAAEAEVAAKAEAAAQEEVARLRAGGCAAGAEHKWQWHQGKSGSGRACFKCLEAQDMASGSGTPIWWCGVEERNRILAGGCPAGGSHAWEYPGGRKSGRICPRCGLTEDASGRICLLPQLLGNFGPATAYPRVTG